MRTTNSIQHKTAEQYWVQVTITNRIQEATPDPIALLAIQLICVFIRKSHVAASSPLYSRSNTDHSSALQRMQHKRHTNKRKHRHNSRDSSGIQVHKNLNCVY